MASQNNRQAPKVVRDTVTKSAPTKSSADGTEPGVAAGQTDQVGEQSTPETAAAAAPEVTPPSEPTVADVADDVDPRFVDLYGLIDAFKKARPEFGTTPSDFAASAQAAVKLMDYVLNAQSTDIFSATADFFKDEIDGVASPLNFLAGSATLSRRNELRLSIFFNTFNEIAARRVVSVRPEPILNVLQSPALLSFFTRRRNGILANG